MLSTSAKVSQTRPFYTDHADAYDLLVTDPVEPWVKAVHERLLAHGHSSALVLDAGCGTGRHASALAAKGHHVDLADASAQLLTQAASRNPTARALQVDLCTFQADTKYQAVMCRGVLNDMTTNPERDAVLRAFANALTDGGLLFLDVRETKASQQRADGIPRHRTITLPEHAVLKFTNTVTWNAGRIHVLEESELQRPGTPTERRKFEFTMRPWTTQELRTRLTEAGFTNIETAPGVGRATDDRLFVTAQHPPTATPALKPCSA